jgi:geranylgeranyl diphosphate synthase type II
MYDKLGVREICEKRIESLFAMCDEYIERISVPDDKKANLKAFANSLLNRKV